MLRAHSNQPPTRPLPELEVGEHEAELIYSEQLWIPANPKISLPEVGR